MFSATIAMTAITALLFAEPLVADATNSTNLKVKPGADEAAQTMVRAERAMDMEIQRKTNQNMYDIEATLEWEGNQDLDLRLSDPTQCEVGYDNLMNPSGGMLLEDIIPGCNEKGPHEEMVTYKLGGAIPGIYLVKAQYYADNCGRDDEVRATIKVKMGGVFVFKRTFTLAAPRDEREFYVHANRVNTIYGMKVDERGFCQEEGEGGP